MMGPKLILLLSVALAGVWADNCGVPTGAAPLQDGMWQQWHNRLSNQIQQQDTPDVRAEWDTPYDTMPMIAVVFISVLAEHRGGLQYTFFSTSAAGFTGGH